MAGYNQYRRRWSTNLPPTRSYAGAIGRGILILSALLALTVVLYIFGIVGGDPRQRPVSGGAIAPGGTIVPPPAALVVPTPIGQPQPFGSLPPVQPFLTPPPGLTFNYQLSGPLMGGAPAADVFRITWGKPSVAQVDALARKLGLTGPVREPKTGMYTVDGNGKLSVDTQTMVYTPAAPIPTTITPNDDRATISSVKEWLLARNLLPADFGIVDVQSGGGSVDVIFHPKTALDLLSPMPGVRVHLQSNGQSDGAITEVKRAWPAELLPGAYTLLSLDDAWATVPQQGMVDVQTPAGVTLPPNANAQVMVDNVSIAYAYATGSDGDYLVPIYVFRGQATIPGVATTIPVRIALPAVRDIKQAAG